jgi:hypothetical protein
MRMGGPAQRLPGVSAGRSDGRGVRRANLHVMSDPASLRGRTAPEHSPAC